MELVADVRHLEAAHDLAIGAGVGVEVEHAKGVGSRIAVLADADRRDVREPLGRRRGGLGGAGIEGGIRCEASHGADSNAPR
jgi:hypothetical protein